MALAYPQTTIKWLYTLQNQQSTAPLRPIPRDPVAQTSGLLFRDALDKALRENKRAETVYGNAAANAMNGDYSQGAQAKTDRLLKELEKCRKGNKKGQL